MSYFVTGATGFIGRTPRRAPARARGHRPRARSRGLQGPAGGASQPLGRRPGPGGRESSATSRSRGSGSPTEDLERLRGEVDHLFHLAAIYDMTATPRAQRVANIEGTRHMVEFAEAVEAGRVHMVSSIAAAGLYKRDLARGHVRGGHRTSTTIPTSAPSTSRRASSATSARGRGASTGPASSSATRRPARWTRSTARTTSSSSSAGSAASSPSGCRMPGIEGREINLVPVDFVARAMDHIAHVDGLDGRAFHLTDPNPKTAGEVIDIFARAAHAPKSTVRLPAGVVETVAPLVKFAARRRCLRATWSSTASCGLRDPALGPDLCQLPDPASTPAERRRRSAGTDIRGAAAATPTPTSSGTTGSATSTPTSSATGR